MVWLLYVARVNNRHLLTFLVTMLIFLSTSDFGTGLVLGGGLSFLAAEYGFSADIYKELDVLLVTEELVTPD
jgi:hypothetical protein